MATEFAKLAPYPVEIETFYRAHLLGGRVAEPVDTFIHDVQVAANQVWYELGLYEKYGHDYFGVSFVQTEHNGGEQIYTYGDFIDELNADNRNK